MGFKTGLLVGLGVGYVLGTKAGQERYEELKRAWDEFMGNPRVQEAVDKGKAVVESGVREGLSAVQGKVDKATGAIKDRLTEERGTQSIG
jgi:hypothetical protein